MYLVIPFFCDVKTVITAEVIIGTGRQDLTVADGTMVSYAATAKIRVCDVKKALLAVDEYKETTQELLSSIIAERLVSVKPDRLSPANRAGLLRDLRKWVEEEALEYGIEVRRVRFNSFISKIRAVRLLIDQSSVQSW
ncbi:prohibitin-like protein [Caudoviricetes sp.]|nr:prohibitin-like protein [Caudoviricetes sp.]